MTWTVPPLTRRPEPGRLDERASLEQSLDYQRETFLMKCAGLTADQLRTRAVEPSVLSLLGLLRHLAEVERWWFRMNFRGEKIEHLYITDRNDNAEFDDVEAADPEADLATYLAELDTVRLVVAGASLDDSFINARRNATLSLRWVYLHLIEEYARHNGHADLLRERLDGVTGE